MGAVKKGLTDTQLSQLPTFDYQRPRLASASTEPSLTTCPICICDYETGDSITWIPSCLHRYDDLFIFDIFFYPSFGCL
jgi:hypothetical protein